MQRYKFYATLIDSFQWYLNSEQDNAFQEFIDKINRVPFTSEAAEKGKAFNTLVDTKEVLKDQEKIKFNGFDFKVPLINDFKAYFSGAASQVYTSAHITVNNAVIELYGFADKVLRDTVYDIKTTKGYEFPKFTLNWQHKIYPYCFNANNIFVSRFEYTVTDFNNIYKEQYMYNPAVHVDEIKSICSSLVDFLETHRKLITDKKIFGLD